MKVLVANLEDVFREAAARWTLIAYFFLSTFFIILFAAAVNLDVVNGALAGAQLFGKNVEVHSTIDIDKLVSGADSIFALILYVLCTSMAIFATSHLVPRMQDKGTVDLYLSRPVSRLKLIGTRYIAGLILATSNVAYLLTSIWLIVTWKTHVAHPRFFLAGVLIVFIIATLMAFAFLVGVITSSTGVSIMATVAISLFAIPLYFHEKFEAAVSSELSAWTIRILHMILPKVVDFGAAVFGIVLGDRAPARTMLSTSAVVSTFAFLAVCFSLAAWRFQRKEF